MTKHNTGTKAKPRTKVKDIHKPGTELTSEQAKKVKGGDGASSTQGTLLIAKQQALRDR